MDWSGVAIAGGMPLVASLVISRRAGGTAHLQGLSRPQRREIARAVRQGRATSDPVLAAATAAQAQRAQRITGLTLGARWWQLLMVLLGCLLVVVLALALVRRQPALAVKYAVLLAGTGCLPALRRRWERRTTRALEANRPEGPE